MNLFLCVRGEDFIFQSGEIYGGLQGIYDYGPMGVELKRILRIPGGHQWSIKETMLKAWMRQY